MTEKEIIKSIIELFIAWNGETEVIDIANLDSAVDFIIDSLQEEPINENRREAIIKKAHELASKAEMISGKLPKSTLIAVALDMAEWCYSNPTEEPVSKDLEEAAAKFDGSMDCVGCFIGGAQWQKQQDQSTIELAEDHAMLAGMEKMKEQMMVKAVEATVHIDAGGYPYIPQMELYDYDKDIPLAKEGDKYKVVLIKEE